MKVLVGIPDPKNGIILVVTVIMGRGTTQHKVIMGKPLTHPCEKQLHSPFPWRVQSLILKVHKNCFFCWYSDTPNILRIKPTPGGSVPLVTFLLQRFTGPPCEKIEVQVKMLHGLGNQRWKAISCQRDWLFEFTWLITTMEMSAGVFWFQLKLNDHDFIWKVTILSHHLQWLTLTLRLYQEGVSFQCHLSSVESLGFFRVWILYKGKVKCAYWGG